jgi:hypothetical protein
MLHIKVLNPKAKRILNDLASMRLISIETAKPFPLTVAQQKSITISRAQLKKGQFKRGNKVFSEMRSWLKEA